MKNNSGEPAYFGNIVTDISRRKKMEKQLQESEQRFSDISHSMADWIWEVDENGIYTYVSGNVKGILGFTSEELIGKTPFDFMPKDEAERVGKIFQKILSEKKPIVDLENWNLSKNGKRVCLLTNGFPLLDKKGNCIGYRGVDKDITEQKKAEEERERLLSIIKTSADYIGMATPEGIGTYINPAGLKMTGYTEEEF